MNKTDLALNNLQWLVCHKTKPNQTHRRICLYRLKHGLTIHCFRPSSLCPVIEILSTQAKFLVPSAYYTMINITFTFCTTNVLGCFCVTLAQFEIIKHMFLYLTALHVFQCSFQIPYGVKQYIICQRTNYHDPSNHSRYVS